MDVSIDRPWSQLPDTLGCEDSSLFFGGLHEPGWTPGEIPCSLGLFPGMIDPALPWSMCSDESTVCMGGHSISPFGYEDCLPPVYSPIPSPEVQKRAGSWGSGIAGPAGRPAYVHDNTLLPAYADASSTCVYPAVGGRWRCDGCGKNFYTSKDRELHAIKELCRSYVCKYCGEGFSRRDTMCRHMREHRGEEYVCSHCDATFKRKDNLTRHAQQRHAHTGFGSRQSSISPH